MIPYRTSRGRRNEPEFPYYRLQYWDELSICWVDAHRSFPNPERAKKYADISGKRFGFKMKYRIMEVLASESHPYEPPNKP